MNLTNWYTDTVPATHYRALDGTLQPFDLSASVVLARSGHDAFFRLNDRQSWGVRWYELTQHEVRFIFTVGHGLWYCRREVGEQEVADILARYFHDWEVTPHGREVQRREGC